MVATTAFVAIDLGGSGCRSGTQALEATALRSEEDRAATTCLYAAGILSRWRRQPNAALRAHPAGQENEDRPGHEDQQDRPAHAGKRARRVNAARRVIRLRLIAPRS